MNVVGPREIGFFGGYQLTHFLNSRGATAPFLREKIAFEELYLEETKEKHSCLRKKSISYKGVGERSRLAIL